MRAIGVDLGAKRIGVSVSDSAGTLATPYDVVNRGATRSADHDALLALAVEVGAEAVVVGLPISLDGSEGPAAKSMRLEAGQIAGRTELPVVLFDERFTTVEADALMASAGTKGRGRRRVIDKVAASVMLQAWLDQGSPLDDRAHPRPAKSDEVTRGDDGRV